MELTYEQYRTTVEKYLAGYCIQRELVETTVTRKREILTRVGKFLDGQSFTRETVTKWIQTLQVKASTKDLYIRIIRSFITYCYDEDLFEKNWGRRIITPRLHKRMLDFVSEQVAWDIIMAGTEPGSKEDKRCRDAKLETRLALLFILFSGCRVGEVQKLRGSDLRLDAEEPFFYVQSKGQDFERQPAPQSMLSVLRQRQGREKVFNFSVRTANKALRGGSKKLKIENTDPTTCKSLRAIFSLTRLGKERPLHKVSRALRHKSVKTTDKYYSQYLLKDIADVVNDSNVAKPKKTKEQVLDEIITLVEKSGLNEYKDFVLETKKYEKGLQINVEFK